MIQKMPTHQAWSEYYSKQNLFFLRTTAVLCFKLGLIKFSRLAFFGKFALFKKVWCSKTEPGPNLIFSKSRFHTLILKENCQN